LVRRNGSRWERESDEAISVKGDDSDPQWRNDPNIGGQMSLCFAIIKKRQEAVHTHRM
jgi:hypothetical protein